MIDTFEQIRQQIHEIRNIIGPVNLKLADVEHQIATYKASFDEKMMTLESKVLGNRFRLDKMDVIVADILERLSILESKKAR